MTRRPANLYLQGFSGTAPRPPAAETAIAACAVLLWRVQAALLGVLPNPPLTYDQVVLMKRDNIVSAEASTLADLGINPTAVETQLPLYV